MPLAPVVYSVEICRSSGVEIRTTSLHTVSINSRFSSYVAPWAGPCSSSALSLHTVGWQALRGPASKEVKREETFPSPESPMTDEGGSTNTSLTGCVPPSVTSRGGEFVALIRVRDRVYIMPCRYLTDWGCVSRKLTFFINEEEDDEDDVRRTHALTVLFTLLLPLVSRKRRHERYRTIR